MLFLPFCAFQLPQGGPDVGGVWVVSRRQFLSLTPPPPTPTLRPAGQIYSYFSILNSICWPSVSYWVIMLWLFSIFIFFYKYAYWCQYHQGCPHLPLGIALVSPSLTTIFPLSLLLLFLLFVPCIIALYKCLSCCMALSTWNVLL